MSKDSIPKPPKGYYRIHKGYRRKGDIRYSIVTKKWEDAGEGWIDEPVKGYPCEFFFPMARRYPAFISKVDI